MSAGKCVTHFRPRGVLSRFQNSQNERVGSSRAEDPVTSLFSSITSKYYVADAGPSNSLAVAYRVPLLCAPPRARVVAALGVHQL